jgi:hypothetical protein
MVDAHKITAGKAKPRRRWEDNRKITLKETGYKCMDWAEMVQDWSRW